MYKYKLIHTPAQTQTSMQTHIYTLTHTHTHTHTHKHTTHHTHSYAKAKHSLRLFSPQTREKPALRAHSYACSTNAGLGVLTRNTATVAKISSHPYTLSHTHTHTHARTQTDATESMYRHTTRYNHPRP